LLLDWLRSYQTWWSYEVLDFKYHLEDIYPEEWLEPLSSLSYESLFYLETLREEFLASHKLPSSLIHLIRETKDYSNGLDAYLGSVYASKPSPLWMNQRPGISPKKNEEIFFIEEWLLCQLYSAHRHFDQKPSNTLIDLGGGKGLLAYALQKKLKNSGFGDSFRCWSVDQDLSLQERGSSLGINLPDDEKIHYHHQKLTELTMDEDQRFYHLFMQSDVSVGLHTCGDLGKNHLKYLMEMKKKDPSKSHLFLHIPCCHYKLKPPYEMNESSFLKKLSLTESALTLATRSHRDESLEHFFHKIQVKEFRYLFQFFLEKECSLFIQEKMKSLGPTPKKIYYGTFLDYGLYQFQKLSSVLEKDQIHSFSSKLLLYQNCTALQKTIKKMIIAGMIRSFFGRPLEIVLLWDRYLALKQLGMDVEIGQIFHQQRSPRNLAIWGWLS
jgi:hypothetical protein